MPSELFVALADDLDQLIRLHDRELDAASWLALQEAAFPTGLALPPVDEFGELAYANMAAALNAGVTLDLLAADYAAIYLTNAYGASPYESVWLSDDHLACAPPMFELRELYAEAGLQVADWRSRFDDHVVLQLQYLRHLMANAAVHAPKMANFIDEHLGYWFPDFAARVVMQCDTAFYAALMELTQVWLTNFRQLLDDMFDLPVPKQNEVTARINRKLALDKAEVAPIRFMPGAQGPSW